MNDSERSLMPYYDRTLNYYSPISAEALERFDIQWGITSSVLDLGCGDGRMLELIPMRPDMTYWGLDASPGRIAAAREKCPTRYRQCFQVHDLYDPLPTGPAGWSLVCLFEVLEHLAKPLLVLAAAIDALKPGGRVIGSVPIADGPSERHLQTYATPADAIERLLPKWSSWSERFGRHLLMEWRPRP